jgi:hypothetical protein
MVVTNIDNRAIIASRIEVLYQDKKLLSGLNYDGAFGIRAIMHSSRYKVPAVS